jgi:hypothetical protein
MVRVPQRLASSTLQERGFRIVSELLTNHQELSDEVEQLAFLGVRQT